jgi:hypothetical protein
MPEYSQAEAAALLGEMLVKTNARLDALEAAPARNQYSRSVDRGRQRAAQNGYVGPRLQELEQFMIDRGITRHEDAMQLMPSAAPTDYFSGDEDFTKLIEAHGNDPAAERRMVHRALQEVRQADDY